MRAALLALALGGCDAEPSRPAEPAGPAFDCPPDIATLLERITGVSAEEAGGPDVPLTCGPRDGRTVPITAKSDRYTAAGELRLDEAGRVNALTMRGATGGLDQRYVYDDDAFGAMIDCVDGHPAKVMTARGGPEGFGAQLWMGRGGELSLVSAELWQGGKVTQLIAVRSGETRAVNATSWGPDGRATNFDATRDVAPAAPVPSADPRWSGACNPSR